jgi:hypothetical protein
MLEVYKRKRRPMCTACTLDLLSRAMLRFRPIKKEEASKQASSP